MGKVFSFFFMIILVGCSNSTQTRKDSGKPGWTLLPFRKADEANPIMLPDSNAVFYCPVRKMNVRWEEKDVFNPAAVIRNDTVFLLYRAEDKIGKYAGTSRIGLAWSTDGLHFKKNPVPILYPDNDQQKRFEWEGGCEDPRIVEDDKGIYYLTYTAYDGDKARLMIASSPDLVHWTKHGHAFAAIAKYVNAWSKSGSVICRYYDSGPLAGKAIAAKINGKYWMYWGDTNIFLATSDDLINWAPVETSEGNLQIAFGPRNGKFDSDLVEPGPPAILTEQGIVLIYNSRNVPSKGDTTLAEGTYAPSEILFEATDPTRMLERMDTYFMKPESSYEISGQVNRVCFAEGLVNYKGKWFLYYGTADSKIAAAIHNSH